MNDVFTQLEVELRHNRPAVLLTIIARHGSAPRGVGSHQLVRADGTTVGTIGGGIAEYKAIEAGKQAICQGKSRLIDFILHPANMNDIGAVCGGEATVFCQYIAPDMPNILPCVQHIIKAQEMHEAYELVISLGNVEQWAMAAVGAETISCGPEASRKALVELVATKPTWLQNLRGLVTSGADTWYGEPLSYPGTVFIFGGGHVAYALVPVLTRLGFPCVVVDDREEFANPQRFPEAVDTVVTDLASLPPSLIITPYDYVCIMTRGHVGDYVVERQVLPCKPYYLGVIGSKQKLAFVRSKLLKDGFTDADIDAVHAPIGLPISAATPDEIAISIAGELIAVRARREGREKVDAKKWRAADVPCLRI